VMGVLYSPGDRSLDDLIAAAQADPADDTTTMAEILSRFEGAILATANSVATEWNVRQDAAQGARLGLVKAVRNHTPGTVGFKSYACRYMRTEAIRTVRAMAGAAPPSYEDALVRSGRSRGRRHNWTEPEPQAFTLESVSTMLDPVQRAIVRDRYVHDRPVADIARDLGVSVPAISQRLKTIHKVLRPVALAAVAA
jgi:RNA polymerase sigma factor (sigma-70 family)